MKKKYLKTVEDVLALKDTDTKIYAENITGYYQFVNGILFAFDDDGSWTICPTTCDEEDLYILEEESEEQTEAQQSDIGRLCYFWAYYEDCRILSVLKDREKEPCTYRYEALDGNWWQNCRPLTKAEELQHQNTKYFERIIKDLEIIKKELTKK